MKTEFLKRVLILVSFVVPLSLGCYGSGGPYLLSWNTNHEKMVNTHGGGYRVYYSMQSDFTPGDSGVKMVNVPYICGPAAPTSTTLHLHGGTWYVKVLAYSAFDGGQLSEPSEAIKIEVE